MTESMETGDIGAEGIGALKVVLVIQEDRILAQRGDVGHQRRNHNHISGILNQDAGVAVVGMVVVGTRGEDDIRVPFADLADNLFADIEGGEQLAVVVAEHFIFDAEAARGFLGLGSAALGKSGAVDLVVADIAVGNGDELDGMPHRGKETGRAGSADVAVIGMGAKGDYADLLVLS